MGDDYNKIQDQILQVLLIKKDSRIISRKLGYKFNKVRRWQDGSKKLRWDEFIDLCKVLQFPIEITLENIFGISVRNKLDSKKAITKILLSQTEQKKSVSHALHKSVSTLYRLRNSKTTPFFTDVLVLIDMRPKRLDAFKAAFLTNNSNPQPPRPSLHSVPWFGVVSSAMAQKEHLSLPAYSAEWIANRVQLTTAQVKEAVTLMLENELIEWNGKHFQPTRPRTVTLNQQRSLVDFLRTLKFWMKKSLTAVEYHEAHQTGPERFTGVFRTFMTTPETVQKINLLIAETEEKLHNLISSSEGEKTEIRSFVFTHFDVAHTKKI